MYHEDMERYGVRSESKEKVSLYLKEVSNMEDQFRSCIRARFCSCHSQCFVGYKLPEMEEMRNCYDSLLSAATGTGSSDMVAAAVHVPQTPPSVVKADVPRELCFRIPLPELETPGMRMASYLEMFFLGKMHGCCFACVHYSLPRSQQLSQLWAKRMNKSRKENRSKLSTNCSKYEELKNEIGTSEEKTFQSLFVTPHNGWTYRHGVWRGAGGSIDPVVASVEQPQDRQGRSYHPQGWRGGASSSCSGALVTPEVCVPLCLSGVGGTDP